MNYELKFQELINLCINNQQYVGLGNPNANILFVGKEAGTDKKSTEIYDGSAQSWKDKKNDYSKRYIPREDNHVEVKLRNGNHTWQKYQKLYDLIRTNLNLKLESKEEYEITFVENIFTTELSNIPATKSKYAIKHNDFKQSLEKRKKVFWESEFIKHFSIVLITADDNRYIETYQGEVCELFKVDCIDKIPIGKSKIWVHRNINKENTHPKLVLHTRQLTNGASNALLEKIAELIADFLTKHSIPLEVKNEHQRK